MVNSTWFYGPGTTTFTHKVFISTTFVTQSFDLKMTYFRHRHSRRKSALFKSKLCVTKVVEMKTLCVKVVV